MPTTLEIQLQKQLDTLNKRIQMIRAMPMPADNLQMIRMMEHMRMIVGKYHAQVDSIQQQLEVARLAGPDLAKQRTAVRAQQNLAGLIQYIESLERMPHSGKRSRLIGLAQQSASGQRQVLGNQIGAAENLGTLPLLHRDPAGLSEHPHFQMMFDSFSAMVPHGSPDTPDRLEPDVFFERHFRTHDLVMPGGEVVEFWGFTDPNRPGEGDGAFPSDPIRIQEGALFHCRMKPRVGTHTIHWHGIEPTAMNDGVGKLSFEVNSEYTYQWYAAESGTYFYHCHHNTPLHFEIGMYGALIIDPPKPAGAPGPDAPYPLGGPGYTRRANEVVPYDVEAIWVFDDVDPRWHKMSHDEGLGAPFGEDAGLNIFEPKYFVVTGVPHPWSRNSPADALHPGVAATVRVGQTLLVRVICAAYCLTKTTIAGLPAEVIAFDARTLGREPFSQYSHPFVLPAGAPMELTPAMRFDALIKPTAADVGSHVVRFEYYDYINNKLWGVAETLINVVS